MQHLSCSLPATDIRKNRYQIVCQTCQKPVPVFCYRFLALISGKCVMGINVKPLNMGKYQLWRNCRRMLLFLKLHFNKSFFFQSVINRCFESHCGLIPRKITWFMPFILHKLWLYFYIQFLLIIFKRLVKLICKIGFQLRIATYFFKDLT